MEEALVAEDEEELEGQHLPEEVVRNQRGLAAAPRHQSDAQAHPLDPLAAQAGVRITIVQEESPTKRGYHCKNAGAYSSFLLGVYLCPSTHDRGIDNDWVLGKFDSVDRAAITILHELVHALGHIHQRFTYAGKLREVAGGQDNETRWWAAKLAERRPRRARRNPANVATLMHDMFWREISPTRKPDGIS